MAEILTSTYRADLMRRFYDDTQENEYYMFIGNDVTEVGAKITSVNSHFSQQQFMNNILFGKKVQKDEIQFMVKYYPWQQGIVFDEYDDKTNLVDKRFYCVVGPNINNTGDYRVFKCLSNNSGAAVRTHPEWSNDNLDGVYPIPTDGYIWQYMYRLTAAEFEAYNASGFVPVIGDYNKDPYNIANTGYATVSTTIGSEVTNIKVENTEENFGYTAASGEIDSVDYSGVITADPYTNSPLNEITNYYTGFTFSIELGGSSSNTIIYEVASYTYDEATNTGQFDLEVDLNQLTQDGIAPNQRWKVTPKVKIEGDGTGAQALSVVNNGSITDIQVINKGSGYNSVTASVVDPNFDFDPEDTNTVDVRANIRPILSPKGGHNADPLLELEARRILMYAYITETDSLSIGPTGTFSFVGLIKNPEWANTALYTANTGGPDVFDNRIAVITDDYQNTFQNDIITQVDADNEVIFSGKVHEVNTSANTIYISEYLGPYTNTANNSSSFDPNFNLLASSGSPITINTPVEDNITRSPLVQRSGLIYFMEDITPLDRTDKSREEFKLVLEF